MIRKHALTQHVTPGQSFKKKVSVLNVQITWFQIQPSVTVLPKYVQSGIPLLLLALVQHVLTTRYHLQTKKHALTQHVTPGKS